MKRQNNTTYFKSDVINNINTDLPIKLKNLEHVINQVAIKYPNLKKHEISLIVKTLVEEMRDQLIKGKVITLRDLLSNMRLYTFCKMKNNKLIFSTRVQVTTPRHIKNAIK